MMTCVSLPALDSPGSLVGSSHIFTLTSQEPASAASCLCCSPGVPAFIMASMYAFSSGGSAFLSSAQERGPASSAATLRSIGSTTVFLMIVSFHRSRDGHPTDPAGGHPDGRSVMGED